MVMDGVPLIISLLVHDLTLLNNEYQRCLYISNSQRHTQLSSVLLAAPDGLSSINKFNFI